MFKKLLFTVSVCLLILVAIVAYSQGSLILGGEGNYFTNYNFKNSNIGIFAWSSIIQGTGFPNPTLNATVGIFDLFSFLQGLGVPLIGINLLGVFLVYALPFVSVFWMLNNVLKIELPSSFLVSLIYIINPFSTYHLQGIMFWNVAPLFTLPLIFGILYKLYFDKLKLFVVFGLITAVLSFSFSNIPYLGIFHIFLVISVVIISYLRRSSFKVAQIMGNILLAQMSFFLFNCWWLINLVRFYFYDVNRFYPKSIAISWAKAASGAGDIVNKILAIKTPINPGDDNFFSILYFHPLVAAVLFIPFIILIVLLFKDKTHSDSAKKGFVVFVFLLIVFFFNKGVNPPFENVYLWAVTSVPFFEIFKTPFEKFSILFVFLFSLNLAIVINGIKNRIYYVLLSFYVLACSVPYFTLNYIPDFKLDDGLILSRKFINKQGYIDSENLLNSERMDYRYLSLPGSNNYQVTMNISGNRYYRGMDPVVYAINKPFIAAYSGESFNSIFTNFSNEFLPRLLSLYSIRKIMINSDIYPSFGFREPERINRLDSLFSGEMDKVQSGTIKIYQNDYFLSHFYTPLNIINTGKKSNDVMQIVSAADYDIRSAIFFDKPDRVEQVNNPPVLEFKKISPVKYRVIVHQAKDVFPLVFSESFNSGWKIYLQNFRVNLNMNISKYKKLAGNEIDQMSNEELRTYINSGWVTNVSRNDFVSKNYQGTIQNNNLPNGQVWETWFRNSLPERTHLLVNGYANSWIINPQEICKQSSKCRQNPDGTFDFELVVEFWPQRLFYLGLIVTGLTLAGSLMIIMAKRIKK